MVNGFYMNMSKTQFPGKRNIIIGRISRIVLQILVLVGFYFSLMFIHRLVGEVFRDDTGAARASSLLVSKSEPSPTYWNSCQSLSQVLIHLTGDEAWWYFLENNLKYVRILVKQVSLHHISDQRGVCCG